MMKKNSLGIIFIIAIIAQFRAMIFYGFSIYISLSVSFTFLVLIYFIFRHFEKYDK